MAESVTIHKVSSKADHRAFVGFPWALHSDDPQWVPGLVSMRRELFNPKKNPAWEYLEADLYLARRGERVVGTIAAFVNKHYNSYQHENDAWFGFFDVEDDAEAAAALLDTATAWARERGCARLLGPQSFTWLDEVGMLVEGFAEPLLLMPYNAPYYARFVEAAGFQQCVDMLSFYMDFDPDTFYTGPVGTRLAKLTERVRRNNPEVTVRGLNRSDLKSDFKTFQAITNEAWSENWGFTPITDGELQHLIDSLIIFLDPVICSAVEVDGETIGFLLAVPDFNAVLKHVRPRPGVPEPISLLGAVWHWKIRPKLDGFRVPLMGVHQDYRGRGLDLLMYDYVLRSVIRHKRPYHRVDMGWILESNQAMAGIMRGAGLEVHRRYRIFEKALAP